MPELPEVNAFKNYLEQTSLNQKIAEVHVHDDKIMRNCSGEEFSEKLLNRSFVGGFRRGKYYFPELDNGHHLLLHFGMTGDLKYYSEPEDAPRFERFVFLFDSGYRLGFDCMRKFARILYLEDVDRYIKDVGLGTDALEIDQDNFVSAYKQRKGSIKGFLLDQKVLAGVGNLYADEALYQTRIHPGSSTMAVSLRKIKELHSSLQAILIQALQQNPDYKNYPENWFWEWRKLGHPGPNGKGEVVSEKIAGRTTFYCPQWQKLYL